MTRPAGPLGPHDLLVIALPDGQQIAQAAAQLRMRSDDAVRAAKDAGWPDLDAVRAAAAAISSALPGGDPVPPRSKRPEPIPLEPDVEAAMAAGAAAVREARASVALDQDRTHTFEPDDDAAHRQLVDGIAGALADSQAAIEREHQAQPAPKVTANELADAIRDAGHDVTTAPPRHCTHLKEGREVCCDCGDIDEGQPCLGPPSSDALAGHGLDAAVPPAERIPERTAVDQALLDDTTDVLQLVERIGGGPDRLDPLTLEQLQRGEAVRMATEFTDGQEPTLGELVALADYIVTGRSPLNPGGTS